MCAKSLEVVRLLHLLPQNRHNFEDFAGVKTLPVLFTMWYPLTKFHTRCTSTTLSLITIITNQRQNQIQGHHFDQSTFGWTTFLVNLLLSHPRFSTWHVLLYSCQELHQFLFLFIVIKRLWKLLTLPATTTDIGEMLSSPGESRELTQPSEDFV